MSIPDLLPVGLQHQALGIFKVSRAWVCGSEFLPRRRLKGTEQHTFALNNTAGCSTKSFGPEPVHPIYGPSGRDSRAVRPAKMNQSLNALKPTGDASLVFPIPGLSVSQRGQQSRHEVECCTEALLYTNGWKPQLASKAYQKSLQPFSRPRIPTPGEWDAF